MPVLDASNVYAALSMHYYLRMATLPSTIERPGVEAALDSRHEDMCEVVLHNDDLNTMEFVVGCLMQVFGHTMALSVKIVLEAHEKGKAIAEVETESPARLHKEQLQSFGLTAEVQKL
jgi:ATP-dependent Clp protease adaptor protein ClpS